MKTERVYNKKLLLIIMFAVLLRGIWGILVPIIPVSDSAAYETLARSVASGSGYAWEDGTLTSYWPPGTSFLYAAFFRLFGYTYVPVVLFHILIGAGIVYLTQAFTLYFFDQKTALLAALFLAIWPLLIQYTSILASEIMFLLPIIVAILLVYRNKKSGIFQWMLFGLMIGVAAYIRPTALPLLVILPVFAALRHCQFRNLAGWIFIGGLSCILLIAPWCVRNTRLYGEFTTISTNFGPNLWMGNNPASNGKYEQLKADQKFENEKVREKYFKNEAIEFIKNNPGEFLRLGIKRTVATFDRETIGIVWNESGLRNRFGDRGVVISTLKLISSAYWYLMLLLGLFGFVFLLIKERWRILTNPIFVICAFFSMIPMVTVGQDRYHITLIPMLAVLASNTVIEIINSYKERLLKKSGKQN